ncbi:probable ATP-dependent RNA helicase DDX52 [Latimeria chalumnae]|uniref:probable ATP-dependent RNA helicase DDX52 n=1 Tax=Latimeria chalumnae TaxID=7897 RepID=UPI0003C17B19|nr:PREDICTED: probable ATP-dependent RNA helicase DDX52 [Latimeria chalumnae]|eukprot:XP_005987507.1 PREDICTED: probable ATP-dependent RNA helicase DDX52 [Latimeria chalumnae]
MDAFDLFRKLGAGAKFDFKRFGGDAEKFKGTKAETTDFVESVEGLDFFGNERKKPVTCNEADLEKTKKQQTQEEAKKAILQNNGKEESSETYLENEMCAATGKRKCNEEKSGGKSKKEKKRQGVDADTIVNQVDEGILWTSTKEENLSFNDAKRKKLGADRLEQQRQEKINHFRNKHKIYVKGTDIPEPVGTFEQLQQEYRIHPKIIQNIKEAGFEMPTPIQMQAIPIMLHNREILACAPTGSGKTMAFSIPVLTHLKNPRNKGFRALILAPTRELASQTHRELVKLSEGVGFRIHMIHKAAEAAKKFGLKSSKKFDILVTTPNRLIYLLKQDPPGIDLSSVEWLVVDESDKLFEDGKTGFRDQLATIFLACTSHAVRRAMFSATFAYDVEQWCKLNLDSVISVSVGARNSAVETVEQELLFVGTETGKLLAVRDLIKKGFTPPVLVFTQSVDRAKELFHELIYEGINVEVIHAERTQQQRDNIVKSFRAGKIWVLICTALMARGIDFKGVNMVISYDFPTSAVEYIHRIGRTGRAGNRGKAVTFFTEDDKPLLRSVANVIKQAGCPVPDYLMHFRKLQSKQKKRMIKNPMRREHIRTTPQYFIEKAKKRKKGMKKTTKEKERAHETQSKDNGTSQSVTGSTESR